MTSPRVFVLIVAAGSGQRFGGAVPKQYQALAGKPLLRHSLETFAAHPEITGILCAIHPDHRAMYDAAAAGIPRLLPPIAGGASRQASVCNGLEQLAGERPDLVLIHDAARPLIDPGTIKPHHCTSLAKRILPSWSRCRWSTPIKRGARRGRVAIPS
jgi:2-C-methyl-D-erythritol 4-phosphate cytidylyltransferase/2-C-methyl-D-erythritol 2,4-cyclodiphosphate synthase